LKLGQLEFHILVAGHLGLDGGAMFGVIPRPLWEKKMTPDARNRVTLAMNSLLVYAGGKTILVETGAGDKLDAKQRDIYALDGPHLSTPKTPASATARVTSRRITSRSSLPRNGRCSPTTALSLPAWNSFAFPATPRTCNA